MSRAQVSTGAARSRGAPQLIARAKSFTAPQYGTDEAGNTVQILIEYPDGDTLYRHGDKLIVGKVTRPN